MSKAPDVPLRSSPLHAGKSLKIVVGVELLQRTRSFPAVNWSEVCRRAIRSMLDELEAREKKKERREESTKEKKVKGQPAPFERLAKKLGGKAR